ncbi:MAG: TA system VapC family ribonuclease toxin [Actinomycetota bacterium]
MILADVNVLVYAHREEAADHARYRSWLEDQLASESAFGVSELILSGFLRIVTNPRVFATPTPTDLALAAADTVRDRPNAVSISPGPRHWSIFAGLCRSAGVKGNLVPDAYLAALRHRVGQRVGDDRSGLRALPGPSVATPVRRVTPARFGRPRRWRVGERSGACHCLTIRFGGGSAGGDRSCR